MNVESQWTVYRTRFLVRARKLTEPLYFTDVLGREHCGQPGDYLVESSDGFRRIAPQTIFEDVYVPIEDRVAPAHRRPEAGHPPRSIGLSDSARHSSTSERRLPTAWSG
jgi:hypothetical protein